MSCGRVGVPSDLARPASAARGRRDQAPPSPRAGRIRAHSGRSVDGGGPWVSLPAATPGPRSGRGSAWPRSMASGARTAPSRWQRRWTPSPRELARTYPWTAAYADERRAYARALLDEQCIRDYLDEVGMLDEDHTERPAVRDAGEVLGHRGHPPQGAWHYPPGPCPPAAHRLRGGASAPRAWRRRPGRPARGPARPGSGGLGAGCRGSGGRAVSTPQTELLASLPVGGGRWGDSATDFQRRDAVPS